MSYINAIKRNNDVLVWERVNGERKLVMHDAPYYFYTKDKAGEYTSMFGDKLTRHDFNTGKEFNDGRARMSAFGSELYESDLPIELKVLSGKYYEADLPELHVTLFDIEVDYDLERGYSSLENPYAPINSVALYHNWTNEMVVLAVPPPDYDGPMDIDEILSEMDGIAKLPTDVKIRIELFEKETDLLKRFLEEIEDSDLLSGWNSEGYDIPMTGKRIEMMGRKYFEQLSFPEGNTPKWKEEEIFNKKVITLNLSGRVSLDYMLIFKKFEVVMRPSYKLESISDEILVDKDGNSTLPKLEYTGSLAKMYKENFVNFLRYNLRDTEILKGFEDTLGYVELANAFIHSSTGLFKHVTGTIKISELSTINYCHYDLDVICPDVHPPDQVSKAKGAFVLMPQKGVHNMIGSVDINSLYPSAIRSNNISPETIIGQFVDEIRAAEEIKKQSYVNLTLLLDSGEELSATADEWHAALVGKGWGISGFGTVFNQEQKGIMPSILEGWYMQRKVYQKKQVEAQTAGDKAKALYYKKLQFVYKIKLNSYYGSLLNPYFRFYDKRMGESTTATSRLILLHQCAKVTELLDGEYVMPDREVVEVKAGKSTTHIGYSDKWSVIYGDTDSTYFVTHGKDVEEATLVADAMGDVITESFPDFMRETFLCSPGFDDIIKTGREIVSDRGIFVNKKHYFLHLVDDDGFKCDKIKVMGLATKKTALPKFVSARLNSFIERYLKGAEWSEIAVDVVDFKDELINEKNITKLGITKGVQNVEKYCAEYEADDTIMVPGHVRASMLYNNSLEKYKDVNSLPIISGSKIKIFQLKNPQGKWKSIAFPVDNEEVPEWFEDNFNLDIGAQIERLVDNPIEPIIDAIGERVPSRQSLLTDDLLDF